jgi:hypothetical protein
MPADAEIRAEPASNQGEVTMFRKILSAATLALGLAVALPQALMAQQTPSVPGAAVAIVNLKDGDTVASPFKVEFGLTGMKIAKAGDCTPGTGHHHLIIDTKFAPANMLAPIPMDPQHRHFGAGQTEVMLTLPPGPHTLQLVLGDCRHVPFNPSVMSTPITVTVK